MFLPKITKLRVIALKSKLSFNKLDPIIYINTARVAIDRTGSFESGLLELLIRNLRLNFKGFSRLRKPDQALVIRFHVPIPTDLGEFLSSQVPKILRFLVPASGSDILYLTFPGFWEPISKGPGQYFQVSLFRKLNLCFSKAGHI